MSLALYVSLNKAFSTTDLANLTLCQDFFLPKSTQHRMHLAQEKTAFFTRPLPGVSWKFRKHNKLRKKCNAITNVLISGLAKVATVSKLHKQSITACVCWNITCTRLVICWPLTTCLVFLLASQFMGEGFHYTVEFPHHPPLMHSLLRGLDYICKS